MERLSGQEYDTRKTPDGYGCLIAIPLVAIVLGLDLVSNLKDRFYRRRNREYLEWDSRRTVLEHQIRTYLQNLMKFAEVAGKESSQIVVTEKLTRSAIETTVYHFDEILPEAPVSSYAVTTERIGFYEDSALKYVDHSVLRLKDGSKYYDVLPFIRMTNVGGVNQNQSEGYYIRERETKKNLCHKLGSLDQVEKICNLLRQSLPPEWEIQSEKFKDKQSSDMLEDDRKSIGFSQPQYYQFDFQNTQE